MSEIVFSNARLVLADEVVRGSLCVRDGTIAAIDPGQTSLPGAQDLGGDLLIPGLIELHTDNLERHIMPRPGTLWPADGAVIAHDREIAGAGITTVFNALAVGEVHTRTMRVSMLENLCRAVEMQQQADALKADHYLHLRCEISYSGLLDLFEPLIGHERVGLVSIMDHTPGQRQFAKLEKYAEYYQGKFGMSDAELQEFIDARMADQKSFAASNRTTVVSMAAERGICVASHDDATLEHVEEALRDNMAIAEFPTTVEAARASHEAGLSVLMGGPNLVRGGSHSGNVSARSLAEQGTLDILSSDYVPASLLHGALMLTEHVDAISLPQAIATVTKTPAERLGFTDRGQLRVGLRADLAHVHRTDGAPVVRAVWRDGVRIA